MPKRWLKFCVRKLFLVLDAHWLLIVTKVPHLRLKSRSTFVHCCALTGSFIFHIIPSHLVRWSAQTGRSKTKSGRALMAPFEIGLIICLPY
ncbi:hypothetical protein FKM82_006519 [Ascaphus truei]